ncbi:general transcription factor IIE subunit 2-like isoform X2 [Haliotis rubra]|uniref:general transcription factor IIE subunit 2-like isoform X2 n=1 Tax=Haliotis rubra TaxID=36100 RepID=UPI001EE5E091|nr:general transcription factor IIE subunit 2-like isoform X2 [Haliotis rubra]
MDIQLHYYNIHLTRAMDPELLKGRTKFLQRAKAQPSVEKRKHKADENEHKSKKQKIKSSTPKPKQAAPLDYKTAQGSSQFKFGVLAKIVKHMKIRHQNGEPEPLDIEEILDETNQLDIGSRMRHWLHTEALINNPKIIVVEERNLKKFLFKPKYEVRDRKSLMKLLKSYDLHGRGGILMEDIEESLPDAAKVFKQLGEHIIYVTRPMDKKKVLYYNDKYCQFKIDEEFQKMWRSVAVDGLDEKKIEEYLDKHGITSMQDLGPKPVMAVKRKKGGSRKGKQFKKHNDHLDNVLEDYTHGIANKKT